MPASLNDEELLSPLYYQVMPRQPEGKLVQRIKELVVERGGRPFKIHGSDEGFQEVGIPDLLVVFRGRFIGMEVKQPGEELRPRQRVVLNEIFDAGGVAAVVETVGQVAKLLSDIEEGGCNQSATCYNRGFYRYARDDFGPRPRSKLHST